MSPLHGAAEIYWGAPMPPRLHRGLNDQARYAGFSMRTPGIQRKVRNAVPPRERTVCSLRLRSIWQTRDSLSALPYSSLALVSRVTIMMRGKHALGRGSRRR